MLARLAPLLLTVLLAALAGPLAAQNSDAQGAKDEWC